MTNVNMRRLLKQNPGEKSGDAHKGCGLRLEDGGSPLEQEYGYLPGEGIWERTQRRMNSVFDGTGNAFNAVSRGIRTLRQATNADYAPVASYSHEGDNFPTAGSAASPMRAIVPQAGAGRGFVNPPNAITAGAGRGFVNPPDAMAPKPVAPVAPEAPKPVTPPAPTTPAPVPVAGAPGVTRVGSSYSDGTAGPAGRSPTGGTPGHPTADVMATMDRLTQTPHMVWDNPALGAVGGAALPSRQAPSYNYNAINPGAGERLRMENGGQMAPTGSLRWMSQKLSNATASWAPTPESIQKERDIAAARAQPVQQPVAPQPALRAPEPVLAAPMGSQTILDRRMQAAGLHNGGSVAIDNGLGGVVPGSGSGDKIPAKYEPGEFVVSNDMLAAEPGLRQKLKSLRAEVLADKGMTPAEADAKALGADGLRAAKAADPDAIIAQLEAEAAKQGLKPLKPQTAPAQPLAIETPAQAQARVGTSPAASPAAPTQPIVQPTLRSGAEPIYVDSKGNAAASAGDMAGKQAADRVVRNTVGVNPIPASAAPNKDIPLSQRQAAWDPNLGKGVPVEAAPVAPTRTGLEAKAYKAGKFLRELPSNPYLRAGMTVVGGVNALREGANTGEAIDSGDYAGAVDHGAKTVASLAGIGPGIMGTPAAGAAGAAYLAGNAVGTHLINPHLSEDTKNTIGRGVNSVLRLFGGGVDDTALRSLEDKPTPPPTAPVAPVAKGGTPAGAAPVAAPTDDRDNNGPFTKTVDENGNVSYSNAAGRNALRTGGNLSVLPGMSQEQINSTLTNTDGSRWSARDNALMAANIRDGVDPMRGTSQARADANDPEKMMQQLLPKLNRKQAIELLGTMGQQRTLRRGQDIQLQGMLMPKQMEMAFNQQQRQLAGQIWQHAGGKADVASALAHSLGMTDLGDKFNSLAASQQTQRISQNEARSKANEAAHKEFASFLQPVRGADGKESPDLQGGADMALAWNNKVASDRARLKALAATGNVEAKQRLDLLDSDESAAYGPTAKRDFVNGLKLKALAQQYHTGPLNPIGGTAVITDQTPQKLKKLRDGWFGFGGMYGDDLGNTYPARAIEGDGSFAFGKRRIDFNDMIQK